MEAVDGSLRRLNTDYLDILLLHRPDALAEPDEVAEAFDRLSESGKVRCFGVSNHNPMQIELLQRSVRQRLAVNQLQLSITNATMISAGINVNMENAAAVNRDGSVLDYCRLKDITIQPWSPFFSMAFRGRFLSAAPSTRSSTESWRKLPANMGLRPLAPRLRGGCATRQNCSLSAARCPLSACGRLPRRRRLRSPARIGMVYQAAGNILP